MSRQRVCFILVPIILFVMLAICVQAEIVTRFEGWVYSKAVENMSPVLTSIMKGITHLGDSAAIIVFCLALFIVPKARKIMALPVSITVISSAVLNTVLKHFFARNRPDILRLISETGYSFPSGHAMNNAALYTILILLIWRYLHNKTLKITLTAVCAAFTVLIGYSRIYLGVHYAGDVLGGWFFGFALSMFIYFMWDKRLSAKIVKSGLLKKKGRKRCKNGS
jgi:undecaprenyl-diphosphatase